MSTLANVDITLSGTNGRSARFTGRLVYLGVRTSNSYYYPQVGLADAVVSKVSGDNFHVRVGFDISGDGQGTDYIGMQRDKTYSSTRYTRNSQSVASSVSWDGDRYPCVSTSETGSKVAAVRVELTWDGESTYGNNIDVLVVKPYTINIPSGLYTDCSKSIGFSHADQNIWNIATSVWIPPNTTITLDGCKPQASDSYGETDFRCWIINNQTYSRGAQVSASSLNNATYVGWPLWNRPPIINATRVSRCNSSGAYDYDGSYCLVEVDWEIPKNSLTDHFSGYDTVAVTGRYESYGSSGSYTPFSFTSGAVSSATSGTASAVISGIQTSGDYKFCFTVTDTPSSPYQSGATSTETNAPLGGIFTGANFSKPFSVSVSSGSNTVRFSGELRYMGYFLDRSTLTNNGVNTSYEDATTSGHRFGVFNAKAEVLSGEWCEVYFSLVRDVQYSNQIVYGSDVVSLGEDFFTASLGTPAYYGDAAIIFQINDIPTLTNNESIHLEFFARVKWGNNSDWTVFDSNYMTVSCPRFDKSTARFLLYEQKGTYVNNAYHNLRPVGMACPKDSSITLTRRYEMERWSNGTTDDVSFWCWNTARDNSGTLFEGGYVVSWSSLANLVSTIAPSSQSDSVGSLTGVRLYAIWNCYIRFDRRDGYGNMPSDTLKYYGIAKTLPSDVPMFTGLVFTGYNTAEDGSGTAYQPSGTIAASMNTTMLLYSQWRQKTPAPTISSITVIRCNSSGTQSDTGTYCKVTASWSVNRTYDSNNTGTVTGRYKASGSSSYTSFSFSSGASGASGTAVAILSGFSTETQYEIDAIVTDTNTDAGHTSSVSKTAILTRAKFVLDLYRGGTGMGIGSAAPSSGLEIGWNTQVDGNLTVLGNLTASNFGTVTSETGDSVAAGSGSFGLSSATGYKYGPIRMVAATFSSSSALTVETLYTIGTLVSGYSTPKPIGFSNQYGVGYVSGTTIYFKPLVSVSASTSLYVALMYIKP